MLKDVQLIVTVILLSSQHDPHPAAIALHHAKNNLRARFFEYEFALDDGRDTADARSNVLAAMNVAMDAMAEFHRATRGRHA